MWNIRTFIVVLFIVNSKTSALSYHQPKFCSMPSWNPNGITFANASIVGSILKPSVFVNTNNKIFVANQLNSTIYVWHEDSIDPISTISDGIIYPYNLFVTSNDDVYFSDASMTVKKWSMKTNTLHIVMTGNITCDSLFVDINDTLYCSMFLSHQVVKRSLKDPDITSSTVAAGTGSRGIALNELNKPFGIFVDVNFDLYVADCGNNRVQLFRSGVLDGITVAGSKSTNPTNDLYCPQGIVLDAERNLFIVDSGNRRIIRSNVNGFQCMLGCYGKDSQSYQFKSAADISFDRFGNIFISDAMNHEIQKFQYLETCFPLSFNQPKFCSTPSWNPNAITFAVISEYSSYDHWKISVFVNANNTIYVASELNSTVYVWHEDSTDPINIISGDFMRPRCLFVASNDDIYICDNKERVQKWIAKTDTFVTVMAVKNRLCVSLFVDTNDTLYCSMLLFHQVVKRSLKDPDITSTTVAAGTGSRGIALNELEEPFGIFVDVNFDLYVADSINNRVQLFRSGVLNGITVVGSQSAGQKDALDYPTGVILDAEKNLFVIDRDNNRIIRSGFNGFQCIAGCYGKGSESNRLIWPSGISFDRSGNMFVSDPWNNRIQKFEYLEKLCAYTSLAPQNVHSSSLSTISQIYSRDCDKKYYYYESIEVKLIESGYYSFRSYSSMDSYGLIYQKTFNPLKPSENLLHAEDDSDSDTQFTLNVRLSDAMTYVLIMTTYQLKETGVFSILIRGPSQVTFKRLSTPVKVQLIYSSKLTADSPTYYRDCEVPRCHYETLEINVTTNGVYVLWSESNIDLYGYIYKNDFNSLKPSENELLRHDGYCNDGQFKLIINLENNTRYILVVTTHYPNIRGNFSISISGPANVTLNPISPKHSSCVIGDRCNFYTKGIGLTLDDILRAEIQPNTTLNSQPLIIKISAAFTIIMFVAGLVDSILSFMTFQNKECRQVGCGLYLLASSVTSFLTISMFNIKFWFVLLSQINVSTSLSVLRGGCASIEPILKLFLYSDAWLNACIAIERAATVFKGVNFDKEKSKYFARRIILILPFCILCTLIHELLYRRLFVYQTETDKIGEDHILGNIKYVNKTNEGMTERYTLCVTHYSTAAQNYNTTILFFHLVAPFLANLCSALFIIFVGARKRSTAKKNQSFPKHVREQFHEHKQLIIGPVVLLILSIPRLIIALLPGCVKTSENLWLYLSAYFISFIRSMLNFLIFAVPSALYRKAFKQSVMRVRRLIDICQ